MILPKRKAVLTLTLTGQVRGGKNNYLVTKAGKHIPNKNFVKWRDDAVSQIIQQLPKNFKTIATNNLVWCFAYTPENKKRRDITAVLDAVLHSLEKSNVVKDDCLIKQIIFATLEPNKDDAKIQIAVYSGLELQYDIADLFIPF